jgi:hypothetical protein
MALSTFSMSIAAIPLLPRGIAARPTWPRSATKRPNRPTSPGSMRSRFKGGTSGWPRIRISEAPSDSSILPQRNVERVLRRELSAGTQQAILAEFLVERRAAESQLGGGPSGCSGAFAAPPGCAGLPRAPDFASKEKQTKGSGRWPCPKGCGRRRAAVAACFRKVLDLGYRTSRQSRRPLNDVAKLTNVARPVVV